MTHRTIRSVVAATAAFIISLAPLAAAQQAGGTVPDPQASPQPADSKPGPYLLALPLLYYTPETRFAFGVGGLLNLTLGSGAQKTRPTSIGFAFVYTQNRQIQLLIKPEIYLPGDSYLVTGTVRFEHMPQKYYGIGRVAAASALETYTPHTFGIQASLKKRLPHHVFAGVDYEMDHTTFVDVQPGGAIDRGALPGSRGGIVAGIGLSANLDTRDNVLFPLRGQYFQVAVDRYSRNLGGDFNFSSVKLDYRSYFPIREGNVFALQAYIKTRGGDVPFYQLAQLGGDSMMRGYYRGRYRDQSMIVVQGEYRAHLWKRLGMVGFAGLGEVCPALGQCTIRGVLPAIGTGIRIKLDSRGGTNVRIDYAWGRNSRGLYMTVQEAF